MAKNDSKIVTSNFFDETTPGITGKRYDIRWDPVDGNVEIVQAGFLTSPTRGRIVLFTGQNWAKEYIDVADQNIPGKDTGDYVPDELATEAGRLKYAEKLAEVIIEAHQNNNGQGVLPEWVQEYKDANKEDRLKILSNLDAGKVVNAKAAKELGIEGETLKSEENLNPVTWADFKKTDVTLNTIKELMLDGPLKYPVDAIYNNRKTGYNQDHVRITQYTYKPPRAGLVGYKDGSGSSQRGVDIATQGAQRMSPLEKYLGMVRLPMPTDISDSNNVAWGQDQVNNISAALTASVGNNLGWTAALAGGGKLLGSIPGLSDLGGLGVFAGALGGSGAKAADLMEKAKSGTMFNQTLRTTLQSRLLAMAGVQISPEAILARGLGVIPNSNMELLFNAPALREFAFSWKMTPRDEYEAKKVRHIIRFFKQGMAARKMQGTGSNAAGKNSLFLGTPNVFHVQYKTNRDEDIEGVNRIKTCAVTGCSLNYTPDGVWSAYEEGQPVSTVMSLRLQELEPVYDTDYQGDILSGRKFREVPGSPGSKAGGDLYKISLDEVGY